MQNCDIDTIIFCIGDKVENINRSLHNAVPIPKGESNLSGMMFVEHHNG